MAKEVKKSNKKDTKVSKKEAKKKSYFQDFKAELGRVTWPTLKQLVNNTIAVVTIVLVVAVIVFVLDVVFDRVVLSGVNGLKSLVTTEDVNDNVVEVENEVAEEAATEDASVENATEETTQTEVTEEGTTETVENN